MRSARSESPVRERLRDTRDSIRFHLQPPDWATLTEELPFGPEAEACFRSELARATSYLEYGTGSSTFAVTRAGVPAVGVESDARFMAAVDDRCRGIAAAVGLPAPRLLHGDIGRTGPWGKPVLPSVRRPRRWINYPDAPWGALGPEFRADLVLVDGRFRVACALGVVWHQGDADWTILVDDYADRPEYRPIEEYARLDGLHGRMARFRPLSGVRPGDVKSAFDRAVSDWR